jgi:DNA primase
MSENFSADDINRIQDKVSILDVVSTRVLLQELAGRYWGLCPFHKELTASFSVTPGKGVYYCFGCHKGGGIFQFVMETQNITFIEAVEILSHWGENLLTPVAET